jgi:hypothetical protein
MTGVSDVPSAVCPAGLAETLHYLAVSCTKKHGQSKFLAFGQLQTQPCYKAVVML